MGRGLLWRTILIFYRLSTSFLFRKRVFPMMCAAFVAASPALRADPSESEHTDFLARRIEAEGWGNVTKPPAPETPSIYATLLEHLNNARRESLSATEEAREAAAPPPVAAPEAPPPRASLDYVAPDYAPPPIPAQEAPLPRASLDSAALLAAPDYAPLPPEPDPAAPLPAIAPDAAYIAPPASQETPLDVWQQETRRPTVILAAAPATVYERSLASRPMRQQEYTRPYFPESVAGERYGVIAGLNHPLTQRYINQYSTPEGIAWLMSMVKRGEPYMAFIWKEIYTRNLPHELLYLPLIESAYLPTAISRAGAAGLWQFMTNSMTPYDMKVSEWMDERMDFWKSTVGALRKLDENNRELKDWALALAAYNAGLGGVSRTVQRTGLRDYWALADGKHISTETINYVPKLLAFSHILSNLRLFGAEPFWAEDPAWTRLRIGRTVDLELLAKEAGVDPAALKKANSELVYEVTPPDADYYLKVRKADAAAISAVLERKDLNLIRYYIHTIKSGDTLSELAQHYGISMNHIMSANPGLQARYLKIGARVLIPAFKEAEPFQRRATPAGSYTGTHKVVKGESLWGIARRYNIDPEELAKANNMKLNDVLSIGKILKTPR
jgi:membrane-bound lytic murein transglycosylase D